MSIFLVLGLVIITVFTSLIFFDFDNASEKLELSEASLSNLDGPTLKGYVEGCIDKTSLPGLYLLANNGGYIYYFEEVLLTENNHIAYSMIDNQKTGIDEDFMKEELSRFIINSLRVCMQDMKTTSELDLDFSNGSVETKFYEDKVILDIYFPVTIRNNDPTLTVSEFRESYPIRFGYLLDMKDEILKILKENEYKVNFAEFEDFDSQINIMPYSEDSFIISILDEDSNVNDNQFVYNFAVKFSSNTNPELDFIPDFVLDQGQLFSYNISGKDNDGDALSYYIENPDDRIAINETSGLLRFNAPNYGNSNYRLCVKDVFGASDCLNVTFFVGGENE